MPSVPIKKHELATVYALMKKYGMYGTIYNFLKAVFENDPQEEIFHLSTDSFMKCDPDQECFEIIEP